MKKKLISVIIPVYNVEKYLKECLDSVINQTLKDIEIICINDGSTDSSLDIMKEYAQKDERIIIISQENCGPGFTRGEGVNISKGEYIVFLDSDDFLATEDILEKLWQKAAKNRPDIIICDYILPDGTRYKFNELTIEKDNENYKIPQSLIFNHQSACYPIYSRALINRYTDWYFPKHIYFEDVLFHMQVMLRAKQVERLPELLTIYRISNKDSITHSPMNIEKFRDICRFLEKAIEILRTDDKWEEHKTAYVNWCAEIIFYRLRTVSFKPEFIEQAKNMVVTIYPELEPIIKEEWHSSDKNHPALKRSNIFLLKSFTRLNIEALSEYLPKTYLKTMEKTICMQGRELSKCYKALENCNQEIANLNVGIANYQQEINNITSSITFKFAKKLASIASLILRGKK